MDWPVRRSLALAFSRFLRSEDGGLTIWGLFLFLTIAMVCGLAIDAARFQTRTVQMQNAANSAAHAALITRRTASASTAIDRAIAIAQGHMPSSRYGTVLAPADVQFGRWDATNRTFTADPDYSNTVRVTIRQTAASGNPFPTSLLRLLGIQHWSAIRTAVFRNNISACLRNGIYSQGAMKFDANNSFYSPICLHSNTSFTVSNYNSFETGVGVSVPDSTKVVADFANNPGLQEALSYRTVDLRSSLDEIPRIISGLTTPGSAYIPPYITDHTPLGLPIVRETGTDFYEVKGGQITSGRIYSATCSSDPKVNPQTVVIRNSTILSQVVIVTNCRVVMEKQVAMSDTVIATSSTAVSTGTGTSANSIHGDSSVVLGANDGCASGGGVQLVTRGGISFSAGLSMYGAQMLAAQNVTIAAQPDGTVGSSIVTGGNFTSTAQGTWRSCPNTSSENHYLRSVAALVQ